MGIVILIAVITLFHMCFQVPMSYFLGGLRPKSKAGSSDDFHLPVTIGQVLI